MDATFAYVDALTFVRASEYLKRSGRSLDTHAANWRSRSHALGVQLADQDVAADTQRSANEVIATAQLQGATNVDEIAEFVAGYYLRRRWLLSQAQKGEG